MQQPRWDDPALKGGTMVRGALWLLQEIGIGGTFTKEDLRQAFPQIAQADRRIRDLRDYDWVLATPAQDATLLREQTRFVKAGVEVWDPAARRAANPEKAISTRIRQQVMSRDDYMCTVCGIAGGDEYPDDQTQTAILGVFRTAEVPTTELGDSLVTLCKQCASGRSRARTDSEKFLADVHALTESDLERFRDWADAGRRMTTALDRTWSRFLRLAPSEKDDVLASLNEHGRTRG